MRPEDLKFHPHEIASIMADAQSIDLMIVPEDIRSMIAEISRKTKKTDADKELLQPYKDMSLSAGAKTFCKNLAKQYVYDYRPRIENKYMEKGLALEEAAIKFLSNRRFRKYVKNTERRKSEYLSGECDIWVPGDRTIDIKVSWSLETFPAFTEDAHDSTYEWQGRSYAKLWNVPRHEVVFVLLDTPSDILPRWEQIDLHQVEHINAALRTTSIIYERCPILEAKLDLKCKIAHAYTLDCIERIKFEHGLRG